MEKNSESKDKFPLNNTIGYEITKKINNHTIPIFRSINGELKAHGTGVLILYEDKHFLISAAHVLEDKFINEIVIQTSDNSLRELGPHQKVITSLHETTNRDDDKIDVGVIIFLDSETLNDLKDNYDFLNYQKTVPNHIPNKDDFNYIILGYPEVKTKVDPLNKEIESQIFIFFTKISEFIFFEKYGCNKEDHIFIDFPKKLEKLNEENKIEKIYRPEGISGCGLWYLSQDTSTGLKKIDYSLIGIMIEYRIKYARVMIGVKFKFIDDIIRNIQWV